MLAVEQAGRDKPPGGIARSLAVAAFLAAIAVAWQSATLFRLDLAFTATETEVSFWGRDNYQPTGATREHTDQALEALLAAAPDHPDYLALAAYQEAWRAYSSYDPALAHMHALRAMNLQFLAQESRPAYRQGWVKLVEYARRARGYKVGATQEEGGGEKPDLARPGRDDAGVLVRFAQQRLDALQPDPIDGA